MILVFIAFIAFLYYLGTRNHSYWSKKRVIHEKPLPFVGNNLKQFKKKASFAMMATELYNKFPEEKVVGFYRGIRPELLIRDPELIKRVLSVDFWNFHSRGMYPHRTVIEPLLRNLFFADGDLWRLLRQRFTPAFSSGKLKLMFPFITNRAEKLQTITENICELDFYDVKELMARYTTDFIGVCGFGIDLDALDDENSEFRKLGRRIFYRSFRDTCRSTLKYIFPETFKHWQLLCPELNESMMGFVKSVAEKRNYEPSGKNDFIDQMLELRKQGKLIGESIDIKNLDGTPKIVEIDFDDIIMTSQVFLFFGAGFETSSTTSSYTLHQLAFNPDCQLKVQEEIDIVLSKYNNKLTYEAIKEMHYLEMAFLEAMRLYPSVAFLMRMCSTPTYTFPEIGLTIEDGIRVIIPIQALHLDEKYFENPLQFNPDRFVNGLKEHSAVYLPFGYGPRACVGARLGQMQAMAGIAAVLQKFTVEPAACSLRFPKPDPQGTVSESFIGGLPLKFRKRGATSVAAQ